MSTTSSDKIIIALDAMGGDNAPDSVLIGANKVLSKHKNIAFLIFGDEEIINEKLVTLPRLAIASTVHHTSDIISDDDKPATAIRRGRNSSMGKAIRAVRKKEAHCAVSSGNTGALMAMSKVMLNTLPGIDRPAIAGILPTCKHKCVMLDLGANVHCDANNLFEFAVMGDAFYRAVLHKENPSIGLLNIGTEDLKGHNALRDAATQLSESDLDLNFFGFIEGSDIGRGDIDVIVTDGFSGNIALKTAEGTATMFATLLKSAIKRSPLAYLGILFTKPALNSVRKRLDPRLYNGAIFLGLNGIIVKSHGSTDAVGFANAVSTAYTLAEEKINDKIIEGMVSSGHIISEEYGDDEEDLAIHE